MAGESARDPSTLVSLSVLWTSATDKPQGQANRRKAKQRPHRRGFCSEIQTDGIIHLEIETPQSWPGSWPETRKLVQILTSALHRCSGKMLVNRGYQSQLLGQSKSGDVTWEAALGGKRTDL